MANNCNEQYRDIKQSVRRGDARLVHELLKGEYSYSAVLKQLFGDRNIKEPVYNAIKRVVESRNNLISPE